MEILSTKPLYEAKAGERTYLSMHEREYEHGGRRGRYFFVTRGGVVVPPESKRPDAVVVVATIFDWGEPKRLVMISEYRIPIGCRELGFPAGLVDPGDYGPDGDIDKAVRKAACREFKEEVGLDLQITEVSHHNLYSSPGMTDESSCIVMGTATGTPSVAGNEAGEDIRIVLLDRDGVHKVLHTPAKDQSLSKAAWPLLWAFNLMGL